MTTWVQRGRCSPELGYGLPDTTSSADNVVGRGDLAGYTLTTARMSDGAMLASKDLVVSIA